MLSLIKCLNNIREALKTLTNNSTTENSFKLRPTFRKAKGTR